MASRYSRRRFLKDVGCTGSLALTPGLVQALGGGWELHAQQNALFTLGVASGDPTADAVVLWTRLAPDPLNGGGMEARVAEVRWEVASDPSMGSIVRSGVASAHPRDGHAVAVNVDGLQSDTWYYYRFTHRGERSRIGRTRTLPASGALPSGLRFALVSCQNYEQGYYAAYRDIASQNLDLVIHVGDYIYESAARIAVPPERRHTGGETFSVEDYRNRYAQYRLDPDLQNAHAAFPFVVTWDDHEVDNNYAGTISEDDQTAQAFLQRRANAYKVYAETMALRPNVKAKDGTMNLYRAVRFGELAEFLVLDGRQVRTDQPCGDGFQVLQACPDIVDPSATMLGEQQESWLFRNLRTSRAVWKVLTQQVMMMRWDLGAIAPFVGLPAGVNIFNVDAWDGYQVARDRVMRFLADNAIENAVVLTGDIHSSWAADLRADFTDPSSEIVGAEFVCSGITSSFGDTNIPLVTATLPANPHIRFFDGAFRGYVLCTVTPDQWRADYRAVPRVAHPIFTVPSADLPLFNLASFTLTSGSASLTRAA